MGSVPREPNTPPPLPSQLDFSVKIRKVQGSAQLVHKTYWLVLAGSLM